MATQSVARSCSRLSRTAPSSAAQTFIQLAPRRTLHNAPLLDFLLPSLLRSHPQQPTSQKRYLQTQTRTFASFTSHQETKVVFNPRKDDDGKEIGIEILPGAVKKLEELITLYSNPNLALRIIVESGGCHGFQYFTSLTTLPSPLAITSPSSSPSTPATSPDPNSPEGIEPLTEAETTIKLDDEDTVFAATNGNVTARVVVDGSSLDLLKDIKVDFTNDLMGSEFKIVENPGAATSCGCGVSFDIK